VDLKCPSCGSEDLARDDDVTAGAGVPTRCSVCGHRWRRIPRPVCPRCGSGDVDETAIDGWAYDDLEEARENPATPAWGYVDKTSFRCRACRDEWTVAGENRPYRP
jgi:hypothetical protein